MAIHPVSKEHYTAGRNIETMLQYFGAIKIIFADDPNLPIWTEGSDNSNTVKWYSDIRDNQIHLTFT